MAHLPGGSFVLRCLLVVSLLLAYALAQDSASVSLTVSASMSTSSYVASTRSGQSLIPLSTYSVTVVSVTHTIPLPSASVSSTPAPIALETKIDPAFGVLGALLILTGLPMAFWGHKNRWTSFFLSGFYTLSIVCFVLITKFGILPAVNPPSKTLRGMFLLSSVVAGVAGGGIAIFFWKGAKFFIGAWGGLALGLFIQCFRNGGLIRPIGYRWILFIGCAAVGFILCAVKKIHYHIILVSTAFLGATAFMIGVDCYTTAGLKEFYVWNVGFEVLFPKFLENGIEYPVSQAIQIELGLMGAVALMGIAIQLRILKVLQRKLTEIEEEQRKRDEEENMEHAERFESVLKEKEDWEKAHPTLTHNRNASGLSTMPLLKDTAGHARSGTETPDEDKLASGSQSPGTLPTLDLGSGIEGEVKGFLSDASDTSKKEGSKEKEELLQEIESIRKSIDVLRSETSSTRPPTARYSSFSSARTLSTDVLSKAPSHLRAPRTEQRGRAHSMELSTLAEVGSTIGRPRSAPLRDDDWDAYLHDRKLIQPPSGVTAPIPTSPVPVVNPARSSRILMPPAVAEALVRRKELEKNLLGPESEPKPDDSSEDNVPISQLRPQHKKTLSAGSSVPVTILPPRKPDPTLLAPSPQRPVTKTFEELNDRHREKMRGLQAPVTQKERESADLEAAKRRWERSKALEKEATLKRQAEKLALLEQEKKKQRHQTESPPSPTQGSKHARSLSADKLGLMAGGTSSSKRLSAMKVQDWQRYQSAVGETGARRSGEGSPLPSSSGSRGHSRRPSGDRLNYPLN